MGLVRQEIEPPEIVFLKADGYGDPWRGFNSLHSREIFQDIPQEFVSFSAKLFPEFIFNAGFHRSGVLQESLSLRGELDDECPLVGGILAAVDIARGFKLSDELRGGLLSHAGPLGNIGEMRSFRADMRQNRSMRKTQSRMPPLADRQHGALVEGAHGLEEKAACIGLAQVAA
nr:hypothetical protein [Microvirga flavescens]